MNLQTAIQAGLVETTEVLTSNILSAIAADVTLGNLDCDTIVVGGIVSLVLTLNAATTDFVTPKKPIAIALIAELKTAEFGKEAATVTPVAATAPIDFVALVDAIRGGKPLEERGLRNWIEGLVSGEYKWEEILPILPSDGKVQAATQKWAESTRDNSTVREAIRAAYKQNGDLGAAMATFTLAKLYICKEGKLDVEATLRYIDLLAAPRTQVQKKFEGVRPTHILVALGIQFDFVVDPWTLTLIQGANADGLDPRLLPEGVLKALIWAKRTGHKAMPTYDPYNPEITGLYEGTLSQRFAVIVEDFVYAVSQGDTIAKSISVSEVPA